MLKLRLRKSIRWVFALAYLCLAVAMLAGLGFVAFTLFGVVGGLGLLIVVGAILVAGVSAAIEDECPGGFNQPPGSTKKGDGIDKIGDD